MKVEKKHLDFIPKIYDSVFEPELWSEILEEFIFYSGADAGSLMLGDNKYPEISTLITTDAFSQGVDEYNRLHGQSDAEALSLVNQQPIYTWITEEEAFKTSADNIPGNLWQRAHWGLDRRVAAALSKTPLWLDGISLNYNIGRMPLEREGNEVTNLVLPHLAKAVEINRSSLLLKHRFKAVLSALDHLKIGVAILNTQGEIILLNSRAQNTIDSKNGIYVSRSNKFTTHPTSSQHLFLERLALATSTASLKSTSSTITISKKSGGLPWILQINPLSKVDGSFGSKFSGAAVFISDPEQKETISFTGMDEVFGLSAAELEICSMLTQGLKIDAIAEARNVSARTVKGQISNVFSKTGTSSQTELILLALKVNLPVELPSE